MEFRASFCHPLKSDIEDLGDVDRNQIVEIFEKIPWQQLINDMKTARDEDLQYSPSLEIEHKKSKNGITASLLEGGEWYIFFKRPKQRKLLYGLINRVNENFLSEIHGQAESDVRACLQALMHDDHTFLEEKIP